MENRKLETTQKTEIYLLKQGKQQTILKAKFTVVEAIIAVQMNTMEMIPMKTPGISILLRIAQATITWKVLKFTKCKDRLTKCVNR